MTNGFMRRCVESWNMTKQYFRATLWLKWIAILCSRYASPPPLEEKISSSLIFQQFSHFIVEIWKMRKKNEKWRTRFTPTKFAHFWVVSVRKYMVKTYLIYDCFEFLDWLFSAFFNNSVREFLNYLVKNEWLKMSLQFYSHIMAEMNYLRVQIHVIT